MSVAKVSGCKYNCNSEGIACRRITRTAFDALWDSSHPLHDVHSLFVLLDKVQTHIFSSRTDLDDNDLEISELIQETVITWDSLSHMYYLSDPVKLHIFAVHVLEFCCLYKATPGAFSEQDGESLHHVFRETLQHCKSQGQKALLKAVCRFTAFNF